MGLKVGEKWEKKRPGKKKHMNCKVRFQLNVHGHPWIGFAIFFQLKLFQAKEIQYIAQCNCALGEPAHTLIDTLGTMVKTKNPKKILGLFLNIIDIAHP